jgi:enoyl-CoA hydratase
LINSGRAIELILTGDIIDAGEAFRLGMVNKIYPLTDLMNKAKELADKIASKGQYAVKQALKAVTICDEVSGNEGLKFEASLFSLCCGTDDFKEGTSAFLEKRKPAFKNK